MNDSSIAKQVSAAPLLVAALHARFLDLTQSWVPYVITVFFALTMRSSVSRGTPMIISRVGGCLHLVASKSRFSSSSSAFVLPLRVTHAEAFSTPVSSEQGGRGSFLSLPPCLFLSPSELPFPRARFATPDVSFDDLPRAESDGEEWFPGWLPAPCPSTSASEGDAGGGSSSSGSSPSTGSGACACAFSNESAFAVALITAS
mmetsp:Transcript_4393/g.10056  ORF Transcript_4393/g.10056 Transcript_4393/m.10056 type:complete len:202 (+) Transcript_4393:732-1337(+)